MSEYRVWNVVNPPERPFTYEVSGPEEGYRLIERLAARQLDDPSVESNAFGLEMYNSEEGEWEDWYDEEGCTLDEWAEEVLLFEMEGD